MKKYKVTVEKRLYSSGVVKVTAANADAAQTKVEKKIESGKLQTTDITWEEPQYEDLTFQTTGDVKEA